MNNFCCFYYFYINILEQNNIFIIVNENKKQNLKYFSSQIHLTIFNVFYKFFKNKNKVTIYNYQ